MKYSLTLSMSSLSVLDGLSVEQKGELFQAIYDYNQDKEPVLSGVMLTIFLPFKASIDQTKEKDKVIRERNAVNGVKGGRPKMKIITPQAHKKMERKAKKREETTLHIPGLEPPEPVIPESFKKWNDVDFINELKKFEGKHDKNTLNTFYKYWSEKDATGKKMRFQLQDTWETGKRLGTWVKNNNSFVSKGTLNEQTENRKSYKRIT